MAPKNVLVVDDDRELADLYADWLDEQYTVHTAYGGNEALDLLEEADDGYDAILLDRRMPDLTGDLTLVVLRDRGYDYPVAMVTAVEPDVDVLDLGFDDYLVKPATRGDLYATVERLHELESLDSVARELSMLRVKRNVLAVEHTAPTLEANRQFLELEARIETLEARLNGDVPLGSVGHAADD
jgi:DNA-binding response OmpR family regulator